MSSSRVESIVIGYKLLRLFKSLITFLAMYYVAARLVATHATETENFIQLASVITRV